MTTIAEIELSIKNHNLLHIDKVPQYEDIEVSGFNVGRVIAKEVLEEYPEFPAGAGCYEKDIVLKNKDGELNLEAIFVAYCDIQLDLQNTHEHPTYKKIAELKSKFDLFPDLDSDNIIGIFKNSIQGGFKSVWSDHVIYNTDNTGDNPGTLYNSAPGKSF